MNGVNLKATGGLRVMNGAVAQCRSIKDFSFQAPHIHRMTCRQSVDIALEI
jgi:hypothetical protein